MSRRVTIRSALAIVAGLALLLAAFRAGRDTAELPELVWITRTGHSYHREDCRHVIGRGVRVTLAEAQGAFQPCRVCRPPVTPDTPSGR